MAKMVKISPRMKHIAVKYHFFKSHMDYKLGDLLLEKIGTDEQQADIFTKGLAAEIFCKLHALLMGW